MNITANKYYFVRPDEEAMPPPRAIKKAKEQ
jgi:hypothetical protein